MCFVVDYITFVTYFVILILVNGCGLDLYLILVVLLVMLVLLLIDRLYVSYFL